MNNKSFKLIVETILYFTVILIAGVIYAHFNNVEKSENAPKTKQDLKLSFPYCQKFDADECNKDTFTLNAGETRNIKVKIDNSNDEKEAYTILFKHLNNNSDNIVYSLKDEQGNTFVSENPLPSGVYDEYEVLNAKISKETSVEYEIEFKASDVSSVDLELSIVEKK